MVVSDDLVVMRLSYVPDNFNVLEGCDYLIRLPTEYKQGEYQVDLAPQKTDCLTAAAYAHRNLGRWKLDYIANMPRKLHKYQFVAMKVKEMVAGDLVFFANRKRITRHVGIAVSATEIFHCSKPLGKACIEPIANLLTRCNKNNQRLYYIIDDPVHLLTQIDKRSFLTPLFPSIAEKKSKKPENTPLQNPETHVYLLNYSLNPPWLCEASKNALNAFRRDEENIASITGGPTTMDCSNDEPVTYTRPTLSPREESHPFDTSAD